MLTKKTIMPDTADMRLGFDRRIFSYSDYRPERRFQEDRRSGCDQHPKQRVRCGNANSRVGK